ncbi:MAG: hypothetical protein AAF799_36165 [Myxococcota bacterium]
MLWSSSYPVCSRAGRIGAIVLGLGLGLTAWAGPARASTEADTFEATADEDDEKEAKDEGLGAGVRDPRRRRPPRRHRFRLGMQIDYVRLSAAQSEEGETQRFHYLPLQLDFGYQLQFAKVLMIRPSLAIGANPANTVEAMPAIVHPQIYGGLNFKGFGLALGYSWFHPFPATKDLISNTRGGLGQPIITNNHVVRAELQYTTRVDRGALAFAMRLGGVKSHIQHYALDEKSWRFMFGVNIGWYFGDGHKSEQRRREREDRRRERRRNS